MRNRLRALAAGAAVLAGTGLVSAAGAFVAGTPAWAWHATSFTGSGHCSLQQGIVDWSLTVSNAEANYRVTGTGGHVESGNTGPSTNSTKGLAASGRFNEGLLYGHPQVTVLSATESWSTGESSGPQTFTVTIPSRGKACSTPVTTSTTVCPPSTTTVPVTTTTAPPETTTTIAEETTTTTGVVVTTSTVYVAPPTSTTVKPPAPPASTSTTSTTVAHHVTPTASTSPPTTFPAVPAGNTPLPFTGANTAATAGAGGAAILSGAGMVLAIRKRRKNAA